jgi:rRNA maturation endonuclease Nob1
MKLAVTDACIFIELHHLRLTASFFKLDVEVHTTVDVFNELYEEQQDLLKAYQDGGKLHLHTVSTVERIKMQNAGYSRALSENDKTVLHLAQLINAMVLSSDEAVRNHAKKYAIECHGMLWSSTVWSNFAYWTQRKHSQS